MAWTYDVTELYKNDLYKIRLQAGDTDQYSPVTLQDEEINYFYEAEYKDLNKTAISCLNAQINKAGRLVDSETGQVSESLSQLIDGLIKQRDDMLTSVARHTPKYCQITGYLNSDRAEIQNNDKIYNDGLNLITEYPGITVVPGPVVGYMNGASSQ